MEEDQEEEEEEGAGPSGTAVASNAGFSSAPSAAAPAAPPSLSAAPSAAAARELPLKEKYAAELATLTAEFPDFDRDLLKSLLEDQAGDLLDVRAMLRVRGY